MNLDATAKDHNVVFSSMDKSIMLKSQRRGINKSTVYIGIKALVLHVANANSVPTRI